MAILFASMPICLLFKNKRIFAATMIVLWLITRVSLLPGDYNFAYQAAAISYTIAAIGLMFVAGFSLQSVLIAICLAVISLAGFVASFGYLTLDAASSIYELFGLFAMIFIIGPKDHGYLRHVFNIFSVGNARRNTARYRHTRSNSSLF